MCKKDFPLTTTPPKPAVRDGLAIASVGKGRDATWILADGQENPEQEAVYSQETELLQEQKSNCLTNSRHFCSYIRLSSSLCKI